MSTDLPRQIPVASAKGRLILGSLLVYLAQIPVFAAYLTDDSYIYARFAANLAHHGELAFNLGEPVHAATSPIWAALGAAGVLLGFDAFWWLKLVAWACGAAAVVVFARIVARRVGTGLWGWLISLVAVTEPWFVRWSGSGMETALAVLVVVLVMDAGLRPLPRIRWGRLGLLLGLAPLVRPELILLAALCAMRVLIDRRSRGRWEFWLGLSAPLVSWAAWALPAYGRFFPATLQAKSTPLGMESSRLLLNLRVMAVQLVVGSLAGCLSLLMGLRHLAFRSGADEEAWLRPSLLAWVLLLPLVYIVRDVQVVSRYLEIVLPVIVLLGGESAARWGRPQRFWQGLWAAQLVGAVLITTLWVGPSVRSFSRSADIALGEISAWLVENTDQGDAVAIYDIGMVGYRSGRPVMDLGGLVHPGINELRDRVDDAEIIGSGRFLEFGVPSTFVHRDDRPDSLADVEWGAWRLEPILSRTVSNLGLRRPDPVVYTLYRVVPADPG